MKIDVQGAQDQIHAESIERTLLDALRQEEVDARPAFANDDETFRAIDPVTVSLIVGILSSKTAVLVANALITLFRACLVTKRIGT
jgi:hypothetical protein